MMSGQTAERPRFSEDMLLNSWPTSPEPKPVDADSPQLRCPYCDQPLPRPATSIGAMFLGGVQRLAIAFSMIVVALLRCVRLLLAGALCLVGVVGYTCRAIGLQIAHPHDRWLFGQRASGSAVQRSRCARPLAHS